MPFFTLKSGEEILLDLSDIPEPSEHIFRNNPYLKNSPMFKKWRSAQKARYAKACYKAIRESKNKEDYLYNMQDAKLYVEHPYAWNQYLSNRGLDQPKRPVGRPKLPDHLKKHNPRIKRSDLMKVLLAEKGIEVGFEGELLINGSSEPYEGWLFQVNGRIRFMGNEEFNIEPYSISTHQFILGYC